jgi:hypothetical protein
VRNSVHCHDYIVKKKRRDSRTNGENDERVKFTILQTNQIRDQAQAMAQILLQLLVVTQMIPKNWPREQQ